MKHLDEGELRRLLDEPGGFDASQRAHAATCAECRARSAELSADAQFAARILAGEPAADASRAYRNVRERLQERSAAPQWYRPLAACGAAAAFVLALVFTPLGGYARSFLTIFEPQQFEAFPVSRADLQDLHLLPQADDLGTQRVVRKPARQKFASLSEAQQHLGFTVLKPTVLPAHFGAVREYAVLSPGEMSYTFSASKARAFEHRSHKSLPAMPAALDGTVVRLFTGQAFLAHYEGGKQYFQLVQAKAPRVTSSGASLETLEQYLLSMPNVSPRLAQQIRALGDVSNTVPVPIAIDKQTSHKVTVQGVQGLAIGDNTGLGAGVLWEKNGIVYVVAGPLSMDEVMKVAAGLR